MCSYWAKEAYSKLTSVDQKFIEFMYVASDYGSITYNIRRKYTCAI